MNKEEIKKRIEYLIDNPDELLMKMPFYRGSNEAVSINNITANINCKRKVQLPSISRKEISQSRFMAELDPMCHDVLFDDTVPFITAKIRSKDNSWIDTKIEFAKMAIGIQRRILNKNLIHSFGDKMIKTFVNKTPTDAETQMYSDILTKWEERNIEGVAYKMMEAVLGIGDGGMLFYWDYNGNIKARSLSYNKGYVICPHNDDNGDRIAESIYYSDSEGNEYIDTYTDTTLYRHEKTIGENSDNNFILKENVLHGFKEIPLITKRQDPVHGNAQSLIERFEKMCNVHSAILAKYGNGVFYVKGNAEEGDKKALGSYMLVDNSDNPNADAKFLSPPVPEGLQTHLEELFDQIQITSSTTFTLPSDIKTSGDVSGIAIQLTQEMDIEAAKSRAKEWQNVASKMMRLFKHGLAVEYITKGVNETAITDFANINISISFSVWMPKSETEYNNMLIALNSAGAISNKTMIEKSTLGNPDEQSRINSENQEKEQEVIIDNNLNLK